MPPKPIINKEHVIIAAITQVREHGIEYINARTLAKALGCSTKPLFRLYKNMEELKSDLFIHINFFCSDFMRDKLDLSNDYLAFAMRYLNFAKEEPNLFKALFMNNAVDKTVVKNMLMDQEIEPLLNRISENEKVSMEGARFIYKSMWLLSHGIASLIATNDNAFMDGEAEQILTGAYSGFVVSMKQKG